MVNDETGGTGPVGGNSNPKDYESKKELAARLGVSIRTVDNLLARGLPHVKLTRKLLRFPRAVVDGWLLDRQIRRA